MNASYQTTALPCDPSQSLKIYIVVRCYYKVIKCNVSEHSLTDLCVYAYTSCTYCIENSWPGALPRWPQNWLALKGLCIRKQTLSPIKVKYTLIATSSTNSTLLPEGYRIWSKQSGCGRASSYILSWYCTVPCYLLYMLMTLNQLHGLIGKSTGSVFSYFYTFI